MKTRTCNQCGKEKLLTEFSKKLNGKFGVRSICKECTSINSKDYRKRTFKFQREKIIKRGRKRRKSLPWIYIVEWHCSSATCRKKVIEVNTEVIPIIKGNKYIFNIKMR
jgi:hypothetical protein